MASLAGSHRPSRSLIPWLFPGGLALVVLVNMVMMWFALDTFPGVVTSNSYERGRKYDHVLERDAAIAALGWRVDIALLAQDGGVLSIHYVDRDGRPIAGLQPHAVLSRPVGDPVRIEVLLRETAGGVYQARVALPHRGQWDVHVVTPARPVPHEANIRLNLR